MADRYWVGGTGSWTDATKWSTVSGGAGGSPVSDGDNVYIDGNSDAGGPFEIRLSKGSAQTAIFNVSSSLSFTLSLNLRQSLTVTTSFKVESPLVDIKGTLANVASIILRFDGIPDNRTVTYACAVPIQNIGLTLVNVKLKNNVDIRHVDGFPVTRSYEIRKSFWSNSFNYSLGQTIQSQFSLNITGSSLTSSHTINIANSVFNFGTLQTNFWGTFSNTKLITTNSDIILSGSDCPITFAISDKPESPYWELPRLTFISTSVNPNFGGNLLNINQGSNRLTTLNTVRIPKLTIRRSNNALTTLGDQIFPFRSLLPRTLSNIVVGELAISATALNRIVLTGGSNEPRNAAGQLPVFLESASLKQVIFAGIEVKGFRELSVSFSNSFIGVCGWGGPCRNIKVPQPKTVYWNNPTDGNYFSNSFTSISGGTVALSSFPFPQDTWLLVNEGLNSSATISFVRNLATFLPEFNSGLRTLPMYFVYNGATSGALRSLHCNKSYLSNSAVNYVVTASATITNFVSLYLTGTGTFSLANPHNLFLYFSRTSNYTFKSSIDAEINNFIINNATINFNSNTLNTKIAELYFNNGGTAINLPPTIIFQDELILDTSYPNTDLICRPKNNQVIQKKLYGYATGITQIFSSLQSALKVNSLILDGIAGGRSLSYSLWIRGSFIFNNLIYSKIGNVSIGFDQSFDYTIKHFKLQGIANGATTASIALVNTSIISETVTITYSGLDFADSLSFVHFGSKVKIAPAGRVFAGTRSTTDVANNGVIYTDRPRITDVNAGGDVTSNSVIKINTNVTAGFAPVFSAKYKDVTITDLSLNNSTTYVATFPNYFANNIKVGAKHELKIIRGN